MKELKFEVSVLVADGAVAGEIRQAIREILRDAHKKVADPVLYASEMYKRDAKEMTKRYAIVKETFTNDLMVTVIK